MPSITIMSDFKVLLMVDMKIMSSSASTLEDVKKVVLGRRWKPAKRHGVIDSTSETISKDTKINIWALSILATQPWIRNLPFVLARWRTLPWVLKVPQVLVSWSPPYQQPAIRGQVPSRGQLSRRRVSLVICYKFTLLSSCSYSNVFKLLGRLIDIQT